MTAPDPAGDPPYFEFQVDKPAAPLPDTPPPQYPDSLRAAHVEGEVLAQFIVDATGRVEINTFKVLRSSREAFATAVQDVLPTLHFSPAEITGRTVKQLVQMPFVFGLPK
jgi:protein TonB